ncbi:MAG: hypothetical protein ACRC5H_01255 [Treponemataceae bacterium]
MTADIIGYASVFPITLSLFFSCCSYFYFNSAMICTSKFKKYISMTFSFLLIIAAFCCYQIATPIVFTLFAVMILSTGNKKYLKQLFIYFIFYAISVLCYMLFSKMVSMFYSIPLAQTARGQISLSIPQVIQKINFFFSTVIPQSIYKFFSLFIGNSLFIHKNMFYTNSFSPSVLNIVFVMTYFFITLIGFILYYQKNKSILNVLILIIFIPITYYPFLILPESSYMTYYAMPIVFLLTIYFFFSITIILSYFKVNINIVKLVCSVLIFVVVAQANYYSLSNWVIKNVIRYETIRVQIPKNIGESNKIQTYGIMSPTMTEPYIHAAVERILFDLGKDPKIFTIKNAQRKDAIAYLNSQQFELAYSTLTDEVEKELFKSFYIFSPEYSAYYLMRYPANSTESSFLNKVYINAELIITTGIEIDVSNKYSNEL